MSRERALNQIVTLKLLAEDQRATEGERQAARDTMAKLRAKYNIPESATPPPKAKPGNPYTGHKTWFEDLIRDAEVKQREEQARRMKAQQERARKLQEERARAQRAWQERFRNTDAMGQPLTPEDMEEARRDPLGWAAKQDKRTHNQKQQDMNNAWGFQNRPRPAACMPMATFFDQGGIARRRNGSMEKCVACGADLYHGQGGWSAEIGGWVCTEKVPGPRKKKERQED